VAAVVRAGQETSSARIHRRASPVVLPWLAAQTAIELGRTLADLDDVAGAARMAAEARRHPAVLGAGGTLASRLDDLAGPSSRLSIAVEPQRSSQLTPAEIRVLQLLPTHLPLTDIVNELVVSRNTVKKPGDGDLPQDRCTGRRDAVRKADELGLLRQGPQAIP
jgi:LuxR family transcriptional regulator, maltose regulon positive regulatory protein